ncbi:MAG: acyl carrier protein [Acidimicrobiales bacterium]|nr:acyl carrier protein [Acidimicrobiales bacterium]
MATHTLDQLRAIFRTALELDRDAAVDDLEYRGIESWDSVAHMVLVSEIEDTFDIMLETDDVIDMSSFAKTQEILARYEVSFE